MKVWAIAWLLLAGVALADPQEFRNSDHHYTLWYPQSLVVVEAPPQTLEPPSSPVDLCLCLGPPHGGEFVPYMTLQCLPPHGLGDHLSWWWLHQAQARWPHGKLERAPTRYTVNGEPCWLTSYDVDASVRVRSYAFIESSTSGYLFTWFDRHNDVLRHARIFESVVRSIRFDS